MKRTNLLLMVLPLLFVAACSASAELPASSASAPTAVEPAAPVDPTATAAAPTAESSNEASETSTESDGDASAAEAAVAADAPEESAPAEEAAVKPVDWLTVMGRTEEGLATLGNPDASVTMIDYSDFM